MDSKIIIALIIIVAIYVIIIQQKIRDFLNDKLLLNLSKSVYIKTIIGISLFSIICTMCNSPKVQTYDYRDEIKRNSKKNTSEYLTDEEAIKMKEKYESEKQNEYNSIYERIIGFKDITFCKNISDLKQFLHIIEETKEAINHGRKSAQRDNAKKALSTFQKHNFPLARKIYYQNAKDELWEKDIEVSMSGKNITFTGYMFAKNQVKKDTYLEIKDEVSKLRFSTVGFRAFEGDDRTYWELDTKSDIEI